MSDAPAAPRGLLRPTPLVAAIAFAKLALLLSCASAYGYYGEELYDLACAHHLAWGYVARAPLSIAFLYGVAKVYGVSVFSVRVVPALVGTVAVVLTARLAQRFGAGKLAQGLAALSVALAPELLTVDHLYSWRSFEVLFAVGIAGLLTRALTAPSEDATRAWLAFGVAVGLGLLDSPRLVVLLFGLGVGLAVAEVGRPPQQRQARSFRPFFALGAAVIVLLPYLAWERMHGWPSRPFVARAFQDGMAGAHPLRFAVGELGRMLPTSAVVWLTGLIALLADKRLVIYRPLGIAFIVAFLVFAFLGDTGAAPLAAAYPVLFAAGAATLDPWLGARRWRYPVLAAILLVPGAALVPLALPVLHVAKYESYARALHAAPPLDAQGDAAPLPPRFAAMFGWPELVRSVTSVVASLPPEDVSEAVILAGNDAEAGALDLFGSTVGLPPVISGHDDFWLWGTAGGSGKVVVAVGGDEAFLRAHFRVVEVVTVFGHSLALPSERRVRIYLCRDSVAPLDVMWPDFQSTG